MDTNISCRINDPLYPRIDNDIKWIINRSETIAVVGLSPKPERPSNQVCKFLKEEGYRIIPVNPAADEIIGEKAYPDLLMVKDDIDLVLVFRRSQFVMAIADKAIAKKAKALWMQETVVNKAAAEKAVKSGLKVVMDRCMSKEIYRLKKQRG